MLGTASEVTRYSLEKCRRGERGGGREGEEGGKGKGGEGKKEGRGGGLEICCLMLHVPSFFIMCIVLT